jgi:hypothetical protein
MSETTDWTVSGYLYAHPVGRQRLYGSQYPTAKDVQAIAEYTPESVSNIPLSMHEGKLLIPPFKIRQWGQYHINPQLLRIDIRSLTADRYRIIVAHNFQVDDRNPVLHECLAGIFLSRKIGHRWQQAEDWPYECRTIALLGTLDSGTGRVIAP